MTDEEVQSEEPGGVDVDTQEKAEGPTNDEVMKNRFKLIEGEEVLLTKSPSPVGFMSMYVLGLIVFGVHMLFWKPDALLNENSGGIAKFIVWVMGLGGSKLPFGFVLVMATLTW